MSGVVSTLHVNAGRMNEVLRSGFSQATDLAEHVMQTCDLDYRSAYLLVGEAVRRASREGLRGVDVTGEMLDDAAEKTAGHRLGLTGADLAEVLDPAAIVSTRTLAGGAAPAVVRQMAAECAAAASGIRGQAAEAARKIGRAEAALLTAARAAAGD